MAKPTTWTVPGLGTFLLEDEQLQSISDNQRRMLNAPSVTHRVLSRVCSDGPYRSCVSIAADEWAGETDWGMDVNLVMWALEQLNEEGFVTYRLGSYGLYTDIKATPDGFDAAGFPPPVRQAGRRLSGDLPLRPGDRTEFRNFRSYAQGGPIEKCSLEEHLVRYPDHKAIHVIDDEEAAEENAMLATTEVKKDWGHNDKIPSQSNARVNEIMAERGIGRRAAYDAARRERMGELGENVPQNQKDIALQALLINGKAKDQRVLQNWMRQLGFVIDEHALTHTVWALQKSQLVRFRELSASGRLTNIKLSPLGEKKARTARDNGKSGPVEKIVTAPVRPAPKVVPDVPYTPPVVKVVEPGPDKASHEAQVARLGPTVPAIAAQVPFTPAEALTKPTPIVTPVVETKPMDLSAYPLISKLISRRKKVEAAAEMLMEAGQEDLAMKALESIEYSEFETEVLGFVADALGKSLK